MFTRPEIPSFVLYEALQSVGALTWALTEGRVYRFTGSGECPATLRQYLKPYVSSDIPEKCIVIDPAQFEASERKAQERAVAHVDAPAYSKADIQQGAATQLVEHLDHTSLDYRVLAFYALRSVPGVVAHYNYRPEGALAERRRAVGRWREYIKGDNSPLSAKGALDRPGPTPKAQPRATADEETEQ